MRRFQSEAVNKCSGNFSDFSTALNNQKADQRIEDSLCTSLVKNRIAGRGRIFLHRISDGTSSEHFDLLVTSNSTNLIYFPEVGTIGAVIEKRICAYFSRKKYRIPCSRTWANNFLISQTNGETRLSYFFNINVNINVIGCVCYEWLIKDLILVYTFINECDILWLAECKIRKRCEFV